MSNEPLPVGKLPLDLLARLIKHNAIKDDRVLLGPGIGLDCAVLDFGDRLLVFKSDPITFATEEIGWYAVQVNVNDIATTGAKPRWMMVTVLLPEKSTTPALVESIASQVYQACDQIGVSVIGGHTEITYGLDRPILIGALIGEVERSRLITPRGVRPGNQVLLTKGVPIEATAICARELGSRLEEYLSHSEIEAARKFLYDPGISILRDAQIASETGGVTAMHDPTEGGLAGALWELAEAANCSIVVNPLAVPVPPLSRQICSALGLDPFAAIASGALLLTASEDACPSIIQNLQADGIPCTQIGFIEPGPSSVWRQEGLSRKPFLRPKRDEISKLFG